MKYGKVYFYDRMGNREPSESDKIREAMESFEAPRFRPPDGGELRKSYKFTPLETPPIPDSAIVDFHRFDDTPTLPKFTTNDDNDSIGFPPRLNADLNVSLRDVGQFRMDDDSSPGGLGYRPDTQFKRVTIPDDPIQRIYSPPRGYNPIDSMDLPERILPDIDEGISRGAGRRSGIDDEFGGMKLNDITDRYGMDVRRDGGLASESRYGDTEVNGQVSHHFDDYSDGLVCDQCRVEEMHMDMLRKKADEEAERRRLADQKAIVYEADCVRKEEELKRDSQMRKRDLNKHIDKVNEEMAMEQRRRRQKSPPSDYYMFRKDDQPNQAVHDARQKEAYGKALELQMEEKRQRNEEERQHDEAFIIASNTRAAKEFAAARDSERKRDLHEKETSRKALEFQMEMQRRRGDESGDGWLWWAARPDEHGWREARMKKGNQVERNEHMSNSIKQLEDFKRRQGEIDANAREARMAKYEKIRQRVHDNSVLVHGEAKPARDRTIMQPDSRVEAAWRAAHEQNDKKYRVLQEGAARSQSGAALEGAMSTQCSSSCKRCIRCSRPLARTNTFTVSRKERVLPTNVSWHPS